jgi:hypothetical protein
MILLLADDNWIECSYGFMNKKCKLLNANGALSCNKLFMTRNGLRIMNRPLKMNSNL